VTAGSPLDAETIPQFLRGLHAAYGDRVAMVDGTDTLTYAQLDDQSAVLARGLLAVGVGKGTRIGVLFGNTPEWVATWAAVSRIGAIAVPVSTLFQSVDLAKEVRHADLHGLIMHRTFLGHDYLARLEGALAGLAGSDQTLTLAGAPFLRWVAVSGSGARPGWARSVDWLISAAAGDIDDRILGEVEAEVHVDDVATIIYTSGSSAFPKGVVHSQGAVMTKIHYLADIMQYDRESVVPVSMPIFWVGGLMIMLPALERGGRVEFQNGQQNRFPVDTTATFAPGTSPFKDGVYPSLGMTETLMIYAWGTVPRAGDGAMASPLDVLQPGFEVKVADEAGHRLEAGTGEILLRGPTVTRGMYKVAHHEAFDADGFYRTGDTGEVDGARVHFRGRKGDTIRTSGANVSPVEVEQQLLLLDGVAEAYVIGVPDPVRGQIVVAAVVAASGSQIEPDEIQAALRARLSSFKVPRRIVVVDETDIARTASGKVRKALLAEVIDRLDHA